MTVTIGPDTIARDVDGVDHWFCCPGCRDRFLAELRLVTGAVRGRGAGRGRLAPARAAQAAARLPRRDAARRHPRRPPARRRRRPGRAWRSAGPPTRCASGSTSPASTWCSTPTSGTAAPPRSAPALARGARRRRRGRAAARRPARGHRRDRCRRWSAGPRATPSASARTTTASATRCGSTGACSTTLTGLHGDKAVWKLVDAGEDVVRVRGRRRRARATSTPGRTTRPCSRRPR